MNAQRLVVAALGLTALLLGAIIVIGPRLQPTPMLSGYIEGEPLYLAAPISGQLTQVFVQRGDLAAAGAPLFVVDTRTLAAQQSPSARVAQAKPAGSRLHRRPRRSLSLRSPPPARTPPRQTRKTPAPRI